MKTNHDSEQAPARKWSATERSEVHPLRAGAAPSSNTGRKMAPTSTVGRDEETGEPVSIRIHRNHVEVSRHLVPDRGVNSAIALIDTLAFSLVPPDDLDHFWLLEEMRQHLEIRDTVTGKGYSGFSESMRFGNGAGLIAWGGKSQRNRVYFSIQGKGCSMVSDWNALANWLELRQAKITRLDVAHDDYDGKFINIDWAVNEYHGGGFTAGGRKPKHSLAGDWLNSDEEANGKTFYIGSRASGKFCRVYQKGKELGEQASHWTRVEVEWRAQDRIVPYDALRNPGQYLAGAYPCLSFISTLQERIKTIAKSAKISYEKMIENTKTLAGKSINAMMIVTGGDALDVVEQLVRPGLPARLEPFDTHLANNPDLVLDDN